MVIKKPIIALISRIVLTLFCYAGLLMIFFSSASLSAAFDLLIFYTILSNILVTVICTIVTVKTVKQVRRGERDAEPAHLPQFFQGGTAAVILVTFLGYAAFLSNASFSMSGGVNHLLVVANIILHYIVPLYFLADYILFVPKGKLKWSYAFIWLIVPFMYFIFVTLRAQTGIPLSNGLVPVETVTSIARTFGIVLPNPLPEFSCYPYFFIAADILGWGFAGGFAGFFLVLCSIIGCVVVGIDKLMRPKKTDA